MKRTGFKQKLTVPMKRSRLRVAGVSSTAQDKKEIQRLVRLIVTHRDGGCILRNLRHCGGEATVEYVYEQVALVPKIFSNNIIQADHLVTRANSATYADTRLIVCLCKGCHMWKKYHEAEYNKLVRTQLPNDRKLLWDKCEEQRHAHKTKKMDWKLEIINLKNELKSYE